MAKYDLLGVAENIKRARVKSNYTQQQLADKLSISQNAYSKIELGQSKISLERLFEICEILKIDPGKTIECGFRKSEITPRRFFFKIK